MKTKDAPAFLYTSICCNELAQKTPCVKPKQKKEAETASLGSWRCPKCRKACTVARHKNKLDSEAPTS